MKAMKILAMLLIGLGGLGWGFTAFNACLLPVALPTSDSKYGSQVFSSRVGTFFSTAQGLYRQNRTGTFEFLTEADPYANFFDTQDGLYILGSFESQSGLRYYTPGEGFRTVLAANQDERNRYKELIVTAKGVFLLLTGAEASPDTVIRLEKGIRINNSWENERNCFLNPQTARTDTLILFQTKEALCKLQGDRLDIITLPNGDRLDILEGAAETRQGVFFWGLSKVYRLDEETHALKVTGLSDDRISFLYETSREPGSGRVFVATANRLFSYSPSEGLRIVPGDKPDMIYSLHENQNGLYVFASNGLFRFSQKTESLEQSGETAIGNVRIKKPQYETTGGVFFITSDEQTYLLTEPGEIKLVAFPTGATETPSDIQETRVGFVLATDRALYRFHETKGWIPVPSGDLGGDINIVPTKGTTIDTPVFLQTHAGVFKWMDGPWAVLRTTLYTRDYDDGFNYVKIFLPEGLMIVLSLGLISRVCWRYSLYRYRWLRYYCLELIAPSRVHDQIFISYRRSDAGGHAFTLKEQLCHRFDPGLIFFDLDNIEYADVFPARLRKAVEQCAILLAVIGPDWLDVRKTDGSRRLDDPHDFVRQEIEGALAPGKTVIPVLPGQVTIPEACSLPESLKGLVDHQALRLRSDTYKKDLDELVTFLAKFPNIPPPHSYRG